MKTIAALFLLCLLGLTTVAVVLLLIAACFMVIRLACEIVFDAAATVWEWFA